MIPASIESIHALKASREEFFGKVPEKDCGFSPYRCFTKSILTPVVFAKGKTLLDVFEVGFCDGSRLLEDYHSQRGDTVQVYGKWKPSQDNEPYYGERVFTCKTPVRLMLGKEYPYSECSRYCFRSVDGVPTLMIHFVSQVKGVLSASAFRVESLMVFTQHGSDSSAEVRMEAYGYVHFMKTCWIKAFIKSNAEDIELPEGYEKFAKLLHERIKSA